jgi:hypothetical protein
MFQFYNILARDNDDHKIPLKRGSLSVYSKMSNMKKDLKKKGLVHLNQKIRKLDITSL